MKHNILIKVQNIKSLQYFLSLLALGLFAVPVASQTLPKVTWPSSIMLQEGEALADARLTGAFAEDTITGTPVYGSFLFRTPNAQPTTGDSEKTTYTLVFTPSVSDYASVEREVKVKVESPTVFAAEAQVRIYPNPFTDEVHIADANGSTLYVMNVAGVIVHSQKLTAADEVIALGRLRSGMYFFRFAHDGKTQTVKVGKR